MKKVIIIQILFVLSICQLRAGTYCTPPKYTTDPYTAITKVSVGSLVNSSGIDEGYTDNTLNLPPISMAKGAKDTVQLSIYYDPSMLSFFTGKVNLRIWIDWNQDFDFNDENEIAVSTQVDCSKLNPNNPITQAQVVLNIPENANLGMTRMRVYEDMMDSDGHEVPTPCGYLDSHNDVGQHGECEDYAVNVKIPSDVNEIKTNNVSIAKVVNNTLVVNTEFASRMKIYNYCGDLIYDYKDLQNIDISNYHQGIYYLVNNQGVFRFIKY